MTIRAAAVVLALGICSCAGWADYVPPSPSATTSAIVYLRTAIPRNAIFGSNRVELDIFDFRSGCPEICSRSRSSGYRGSTVMVDVHDRPEPSTDEIPQPAQPAIVRPDSIVVPAGERIALRGVWSVHVGGTSVSCDVVLTFRPEGGHQYHYQYRPPNADNTTCAAGLTEMIGGTREGPVDSLDYFDTRPGSFRGCRTPRLCE